MAWRDRLGREYVMETCKDGQKVLSVLDPLFAFVVWCNTGFSSPRIATLELCSRVWHTHTYASQVGFCRGLRSPACLILWRGMLVGWPHIACGMLSASGQAVGYLHGI